MWAHMQEEPAPLPGHHALDPRAPASQDALTQSDRTISTNLVALYKALGGGWESVEPEEENSPRRR